MSNARNPRQWLASNATKVKQRLVSSGPASDELEQARARNRKLRKKVKGLERRVADLNAELTTTRNSVRDPEPGLVLAPRVEQVIEAVRAEHLSYLTPANLRVLARQVAAADVAGRDGLIIEAVRRAADRRS